MESCFSEISIKSTIRRELLELCSRDQQWIDHDLGTFLHKIPPKEVIFKDSFLKLVCENFTKNYQADVNMFMMKPWTHYILHVDTKRSASINLLINDTTDSIAYFKTSELRKSQIDIQELEYKTDTYYLFNSKMPHAITNRGSPRYVLSITLNGNFDEMKLNLKDHLCL